MTLHAVRLGQGPRAALILHGGLSRGERMVPLARALSDRMTLTVPDLPGHGASPDWDGIGDYQAACVAAVAPLVEPGAHLIGHSFGATVLLRLAVERPGLADCLTLIEPVMFCAAAGTAVAEAHEAEYRPVREAVASGELALAAETFLSLWGPGVWRRMDARSRENAARRMVLVDAAEAGIVGDSGGVLPRLTDLAAPVHLIRGAQSHPVMKAVHAGLLARLPQARETVLPGAGHMAPVTHPGAVAAVVRSVPM